MAKLLGVILMLALGFGGGWFARSYRATDACRAAGGTFDTNRSVCVGVVAVAIPAPLSPSV